MRDFEMELMPELVNECRKAAVSFQLNYWEASDELEFEITSAAPTECGYIKRASSLRQCLALVKEKTKSASEDEQNRHHPLTPSNK